MTGSLPLSFVPLLRSSGPLPTLAAPGSPPPPPSPPPLSSSPPPPLCPGARYGNPEPPNHDPPPGGSPPPFRAEDVPYSVLITCVGSVVVCVAMTVAIGGSLDEAVRLLGLDKTGNCSANFSNCLSVFSSSFVGILISMLSA